MLERIKHFLTVSNVHFVLGVHLAQLANSVKVAYGSEIDAATYLQKFINLTIVHVDSSEHSNETQITKFTNYLVKALEFKPQDEQTLKIVTDFVQRVASHRGMSLRTIERIYSHVAVCLAFTDEKLFRQGALIAGLCILKVIAPQLYAKAKTGKLRSDEIAPVFGFVPDDAHDVEHPRPREKQWWQYCLQDTLPGQFPELGTIQLHYNLTGDRRRLLPLIANEVVDRLVPLQ